ncbi:MAG: hypothetical protein LKK42_00245 [Oscillospiraceae bacterium]|jgi:hypothetical protein|nr:hypothetical protein [Oscillospiraceae bacterium]
MTQTKETVETLRPTIAFNNLDISNVDKTNIINGFCNCVSIPLVAAGSGTLEHKNMFVNLLDQYVNSNGKNDIIKNQQSRLKLMNQCMNQLRFTQQTKNRALSS